MPAQRPGVLRGGAGAPLGRPGRRLVGLGVLRGLEERRERRLGVDDDVLAAGQQHHGVGPDGAAVGVGGHHLGVEVDPLQHARVLHDAAQLHLAPRPADRGGAQGPRQRRRLRPQRGAVGAHRGELGVEPAPLLRPLALQLPHLALDPGEAGAERRQRHREVGALVEVLLEPLQAGGEQVALRR